MPAAVTRPRLRLAHDLTSGTYTITVSAEPLPTDHQDALDHGGLDLCPPMFAPCLLGCPGTPRQYPVSVASRGIPATGQNDRSRHVSASLDARSEEKIGTKQRTLNLRVRGSSLWRRTHSDLHLCPFRAPRAGHFRPMFAPRLLVSPDLVARPGRRALRTPCRWLYRA